MEVILIGSGYMAREYIKVLNFLKVSFLVLCRSELSSNNIKDLTKNLVVTNSIETYFVKNKMPPFIINAVSIDALYLVSKIVLNKGCDNLLIEKPGALYVDELRDLSKYKNRKIIIGYNRRFYPSVKKIKNHLKFNGSLTSCKFQFTEWPKYVLSNKYSNEILKRWVIGNSSHVIDLFIYFCGIPKKFSAYRNGKLSWHKSGAQFCGSGITNGNIIFSYHADWMAPGSWSFELMSKNKKFILEPLEQIKIQKMYTIKKEKLNLEHDTNIELKLGLFEQTKLFLKKDFKNMVKLEDQIEHMKFYEKVAGY